MPLLCPIPRHTLPSLKACPKGYISLSFDQLKIADTHTDDNKITFQWQEGDQIKVYLAQGNAWDSVSHTLSGSDEFSGNRLMSIAIPCPKDLNPSKKFSVYGVSGDAYLSKTGSGAHTLHVTKSASVLAKDLNMALKSMVVTFQNPDALGTQVAVTSRHEGNFFSFETYAGTPAALRQIEMVELGGKPWIIEPNGTTTDRITLVADGGELSLNADHRETLYAWVHTLGGASALEVESSLTTVDKRSFRSNTQPTAYPLERKAKIANLQLGKNYRLRFDIYGGVPYSLGQKSTSSDWTQNWMRDFAPEMPLFDLMLPGSHDSGAKDIASLIYLPGKSLIVTQDKSITDQLNRGVRALDIRAKVDGSALQIYHGVAKMKLSLEQVLTEITQFLKAHPSETVVMMYKDEEGNGSDTFKQRSRTIFKDSRFSSYFFTNKLPDEGNKPQIIRLKDVRGKIVLLSRDEIVTDDSQNFKFGYQLQRFPGNNSGDAVWEPMTYGAAHICRVQDRYNNPSDNDKKDMIGFLLNTDEQVYRNQQGWNINYLSCTGSTIYKRAVVFNKYMLDLLAGYKEKHRGMIMMDYAASDDADSQGKALVEAIINNNYRLAQ